MKYWFKNVADNIYIYPKSASRNLILQTRTSDCNSATDLEELNKKIYTETVFDQIWYIRSGLTHADLIKVAEKYANQKILQARDWKALQKKLQGGDRL